MARVECWIASHLDRPGRLKRLQWQLDSIAAGGDALDCVRVEASLGGGLHAHEVSEVVTSRGGTVEFSHDRRAQFQHLAELQRRVSSPDLLIMAADDDDLCHKDRARAQRAYMNEHPGLVACTARARNFNAWGLDHLIGTWDDAWPHQHGEDWWDYGGMCYRASYLRRVLDSTEHDLGPHLPYYDVYFKLRATRDNVAALGFEAEALEQMRDRPVLALFRKWTKGDR